MTHSTNPHLFYLVHAPRGQALHPASPPVAASHLRGNRQRSDTSSLAIPTQLTDSFSPKYLPLSQLLGEHLEVYFLGVGSPQR